MPGRSDDSDYLDSSLDGDKTPDSLTTSDLMTSSVFDDDLDFNLGKFTLF